MSTILVADDNSNIQKMVGLALKDQGIEVVAVGNGEAAVRRIPDVHPDLVLADVFMPVKNGYEVCEFVKKDPRFSHIPVILLVGAFDPLDEHEAQRVGADGVLKKPFVPPDPLISMVKSALARSAADSGHPRPISVPKRAGAAREAVSIPSVEATPAPLATAGAEAGAFEGKGQQEDFGIPSRPQSVSFHDGETPLAFGSLLETDAGKPKQAVAEASVEEYVAPVIHPSLEKTRNWGTKPAAEEIEEDEKPKTSWRRDAPEDEDRVGSDESIGSVKDWRDFEEPVNAAPATVDVAPIEEQPKASESNSFAPAPPSEMEVVTEDHVAGGNSHATDAESLFAAHREHIETEEIHESMASEASADAPEVVEEKSKDYETVFTPESYPGLFVEEKRPTALSMQDKLAESSSAFAEISLEVEKGPVAPAEVKERDHASATFEAEAPAPNLWERQVRLAARSVAASWPSQPSEAEPASPAVETAQRYEIESVPEEEPESSHGEFLAPANHEEEAPTEIPAEIHAPQEVTAEPEAQVAAPEPVSQIPEPATAAIPAATDIEAVVARVLERMDPSIFQSMTQQLLKPVIEAIVRNELEKKR